MQLADLPFTLKEWSQLAALENQATSDDAFKLPDSVPPQGQNLAKRHRCQLDSPSCLHAASSQNYPQPSALCADRQADAAMRDCLDDSGMAWVFTDL